MCIKMNKIISLGIKPGREKVWILKKLMKFSWNIFIKLFLILISIWKTIFFECYDHVIFEDHLQIPPPRSTANTTKLIDMPFKNVTASDLLNS